MSFNPRDSPREWEAEGRDGCCPDADHLKHLASMRGSLGRGGNQEMTLRDAGGCGTTALQVGEDSNKLSAGSPGNAEGEA